MASNNRDQLTTNPTAGQHQCSSYVSCSLMMYENDGGRGGSSSGNSSLSGSDDCGSWSDDGNSSTDAIASYSSGKADEGCYSGDGSSSGDSGDGSSSGDSGDGSSSGGKRGKWLKSLRTVIDRMVSSEHKDRSCKKKTVKTILRPPTTYKYVIGMSGFPIKVPVYPKTIT